MLPELIDVLLSPPNQAQDRFTDVMYEMFSYAQSRNLAAVLASETAVVLLSEAWRQRWPEILPRAAPPTLGDAVTAMQLLEHGLRPFSHRPVRADVVHAVTNGFGALPAVAAKWRYGTPMIVTEHGLYLREQYLHLRRPQFGWPVKDLYLRFLRRLCTLGYHYADVITPGNVYNQRWEMELGADISRVRTVYNGVDPAVFPMLTEEPEVPTISWAGRIDPVKDLQTLLRAFSLVVREIPQARLRLFGSPPPGRQAYLERCRTEAAHLGISERATFEGRVPEIRDAYAAGHIVVLCSIAEGFPYTLIEAMACGRACVATDVGGVSEAIGAVAGLVVPPRNPAALADACLRLLRDHELRRRMGAAARARAIEHFTLDRAISTFDRMYTLLGGGSDQAVTPDVTPDAAVVASQARAGQRDRPSGPRPSRWIELAPEEHSTVVEPWPDLSPSAKPSQTAEAGREAADQAVTQIIPVPGRWSPGPDSEHTVILPRLNLGSRPSSDQHQTGMPPRLVRESGGSTDLQQTRPLPTLNWPARKPAAEAGETASRHAPAEGSAGSPDGDIGTTALETTGDEAAEPPEKGNETGGTLPELTEVIR